MTEKLNTDPNSLFYKRGSLQLLGRGYCIVFSGIRFTCCLQACLTPHFELYQGHMNVAELMSKVCIFCCHLFGTCTSVLRLCSLSSSNKHMLIPPNKQKCSCKVELRIHLQKKTLKCQSAKLIARGQYGEHLTT